VAVVLAVQWSSLTEVGCNAIDAVDVQHYDHQLTVLLAALYLNRIGAAPSVMSAPKRAKALAECQPYLATYLVQHLMHSRVSPPLRVCCRALVVARSRTGVSRARRARRRRDQSCQARGRSKPLDLGLHRVRRCAVVLHACSR
jgi:hypothetical protein